MENLESAYLNTEYQVWVQPMIALRIGQPNVSLNELLNQHAVTTACFVTAHNPYSQAFEPAENDLLNQRLEAKLKTCGWKYLPGFGKPLNTDWPGERSFLVLGLSFKQAQALALEFEQHAIVWCKPGLAPKLVWVAQ